MSVMKNFYRLGFISIACVLVANHLYANDKIWGVFSLPIVFKSELDKANELGTSTNLIIENLKFEQNVLSVTLSIKGKAQNQTFGFINLSMKTGIHPYLKDEARIQELIKDKTPSVASLGQIKIYDDFPGKGYSSDALKIFHRFLDDIGADYVVLGIDSKMSYTGSIYKKAGYNFTDGTLSCIKIWAESKGLAVDQAEAKYLMDTSVPIKDNEGNSCTPWMIRYKKGHK